MATVTSTIAISGTINGRRISFTHTYTLTDVGDPLIDHLLVPQGNTGAPGTASINASYDRGHHDFTTPKMALIVNVTPSTVGTAQLGGSGTGDISTVLHNGLPFALHYGSEIGASIGEDNAALIVPDENDTPYEMEKLSTCRCPDDSECR